MRWLEDGTKVRYSKRSGQVIPKPAMSNMTAKVRKRRLLLLLLLLLLPAAADLGAAAVAAAAAAASAAAPRLIRLCLTPDIAAAQRPAAPGPLDTILAVARKVTYVPTAPRAAPAAVVDAR
jgi:hypothetical protein